MDTSEFGLEDFLKDLLAFGYLDGEDVAQGITRQVIDRGVESLSEKQKWVFNNRVIEEYVIEDCKLCSAEIPWEEKIGALDNGGYCSWCQHKLEKDD
ncbi:hypothetical protein [Pseudodesulfovibrio portus]|uniref:Uncharacterized protein n=1 Tax=Pseudodesulfovibrio portus TaxID=231439 RepID=A0ABM8AV12_9BACT|nr:hypothetical protein [Pseudodesulfovibrio portus]BDQ35084.1 hypothetical protein JCM14722_26260 [Pseudodesulfovibrio portus]